MPPLSTTSSPKQTILGFNDRLKFLEAPIKRNPRPDLRWLLPFVTVFSGALLIIFIGCLLFCKCFRALVCGCWCSCCYDERSTGGSGTRTKSGSNSDGIPAPSQPPHPPITTPPQIANSSLPSMPVRNYKPVAAYKPPPVRRYVAPVAQPVAPPAARQVARTAKIIGDILASDRGRKR